MEHAKIRENARVRSVYVGEAALKQRREHSAAHASSRRNSLLTAKRIKRTPDAPLGQAQVDVNVASPERHAEHTGAISAAVGRLLECTNQGSTNHRDLLRDLRLLLSHGDAASVPFTPEQSTEPQHSCCWHAWQAGAMPALSDVLHTGSAEAYDCILEAAWCLTNMAAAEHEVAAAVLAAGPSLVALLGGGRGMLLAGQSAWALGNLAGDCREFCVTLVANGAVAPLLSLVLHATLPSESSAASLAAAESAAWALFSLTRHSPKAAAEVLNTAGSLVGLNQLLQWARKSSSDEEADADRRRISEIFAQLSLACEVLWLLTQILTSADAVNKAVAIGMIPSILKLLHAAMTEMQETAGAGPQVQALALPCLRCVGAIAALGSALAVAAVLTQGVNMLVGCVESSNKAFQQEAAWVLSNAACATSGSSKELWARSGAPAALAQLLAGGTHLGQRWAAVALLNISAGSQEGLTVVADDAAAAGALVGLLASHHHPWAVQLAMQWLGLVLRSLPSAQALLTRLCAWDALQVHRFRNEESIAGMASYLLAQRTAS